MTRLKHFFCPLKISGSVLAAPVLMLAALPASADWSLNGGESSLHYVTSKAGAVSEVNTFGELGGGISDSGEASVEISLASVDTMIDIRNERMREVVFKTSEFAMAEVSADVSGLALASMAAGATHTATLPVTLSMNGMFVELNTEVRVTRLADGGVLVDNTKPVLLNVASLGYSEGVEELRNLAGLTGINPNISVDFSLRYDEN